MNCNWTNAQKGLFFDAFRFLHKVPNLRVLMDSREMMLSYKEAHIHINFFEEFDDVINTLSSFIKDVDDFNKENHQFYAHEEISSKDYTRQAINIRIASSSYVPKKYIEDYQKTIDDLISGKFFKN